MLAQNPFNAHAINNCGFKDVSDFDSRTHCVRKSVKTSSDAEDRDRIFDFPKRFFGNFWTYSKHPSTLNCQLFRSVFWLGLLARTPTKQNYQIN